MGEKVIIDNFLDDFGSFRKYCDELSYTGITNSKDNVFYPDLNDKIPNKVKEEIVKKLLKDELEPKFSELFLRMSCAGVDCPHEVHTDSLMNQYSLMFYVNRLEDCIGGTSFLRHKETGLQYDPVNEKQLKVWQRDMNIRDKWDIVDYCHMIPNRALLFETNQMHRAEPIGGFGDSPKNGRLVLTGFFSYD